MFASIYSLYCSTHHLPQGSNHVPSSVTPNTPIRYSLLSPKYTDAYYKTPIDHPYQAPIFATSTSMCLTEYIYIMNLTEFTTPPPIRPHLSAPSYDIPSTEPLPYPLSEPSTPTSGYPQCYQKTSHLRNHQEHTSQALKTTHHLP